MKTQICKNMHFCFRLKISSMVSSFEIFPANACSIAKIAMVVKLLLNQLLTPNKFSLVYVY